MMMRFEALVPDLRDQTESQPTPHPKTLHSLTHPKILDSRHCGLGRLEL